MTVYRIEVFPTIPDTRASVRKNKLVNQGLFNKEDNLFLADVYTIDAMLTEEEIRLVREVLVNPVTQQAVVRGMDIQLPALFDWAVEIGFLPGVTDNIGQTTREMITDKLGRKFTENEYVYSSQITFLKGPSQEKIITDIAATLHNPLIQRAHIKSFKAYTRDGGMDIVVPNVHLDKHPSVSFVDLHIPDDELLTLGKKGIPNPDGSRRGPLALDLAYLNAIRAYFDSEGRNPTDVELESIAQTWSEHCKHTIFADPIDELADGIFASYIKRATEEIRAKKGADDFCVSVFTDNSGAIIFDDEYLVTDKVETHNSPSALDPFGGAVTGIVGVNRDSLGFGLGAKPVLNRFGFCFGDPRDESVLYRDANGTQQLLSSRRIMEGVIDGVNSGGNCSGIPTPQGFVYFDKRFRGKPLVFVGTVGLIPRKQGNMELFAKKARPGDYIVMAGGRVGLDGIHGATFSSEALSTGSPATAVQIGDPITQKKLSDVLIREARDLGLYSSITDNGAGGLSCSVAEMAKESGGCRVNLEKVPLKYPGLEPWQIWISESQERMTLAVPQRSWEIFSRLLSRRGVEATIIGEFTDSGRCVVSYQGMQVMDVAMDFLHDGLPQRVMRSAEFTPSSTEIPLPDITAVNGNEAFISIVGRLNIGSFEVISSQYDHEVQGGSVLKPLQGIGLVNADTTSIRPRLDSEKAIVVSQALFPGYSELDPYRMAQAAIDCAVRNVVAAGADPAHVAILDNFCWCSSTDPVRLAQLKESARGCYDSAIALETPFISGKDSMFNDFNGYGDNLKPVKISVPPTLLISSLAVTDSSDSLVTLDFKEPGDRIYILGETSEYLGGSEYARANMIEGGIVPGADLTKNRKLYETYFRCIRRGIIASAQSIHHGGLAAALAKSAIGGMLGANVFISSMPGSWNKNAEALFAETPGRILVSVAAANCTEFEEVMQGFPVQSIGEVRGDKRIVIHGLDNAVLIETSVTEGYKSYKKMFGVIQQVQPSVAVLSGYGFNCEEETAHAFSLAGAIPNIVHINDLVDGTVPLSRFEILAFPGGFSFGDDTGSGNAYAWKLKSHIWDQILSFIAEDHLVIGLCNGFQVLVNLGLLPALEGRYGEREVALVHNVNARYSARWVDLAVRSSSPWYRGVTALSLPIAHGEGKLVAKTDVLAKLKQKGLIAATYTRGEVCRMFKLPANPNGSLEDIAALMDETGRILGMMPHPERAIMPSQLPYWTNLREKAKRNGAPLPEYGPGFSVFKNGVNYFTQ